jgi:hypothetical protein
MMYRVLSIFLFFITSLSHAQDESYQAVYEAGFEQGYQQGVEDSKVEFQKLKRSYNDILNKELKRIDEEYQKELERQMAQAKNQIQQDRDVSSLLMPGPKSAYQRGILKELLDKPTSELIQEALEKFQLYSDDEIATTLLNAVGYDSWLGEKLLDEGYMKRLIIAMVRHPNAVPKLFEIMDDKAATIWFILTNIIFAIITFFVTRKVHQLELEGVDLHDIKLKKRILMVAKLAIPFVLVVVFFGSKVSPALGVLWKAL